MSKFLISTTFVYDLGKFKCLCNLYVTLQSEGK